MIEVHRLLLILLLLIGCQPSPTPHTGKNPGTRPSGTASPHPFRLISGSTAGDSAVFEAADITTAITNSGAGTQTIHITRQGKRLINYIRAVDSGRIEIPVPQLLIAGTDTSILLQHIVFKIKNGKAVHSKDGGEDNKKAPHEIMESF